MEISETCKTSTGGTFKWNFIRRITCKTKPNEVYLECRNQIHLRESLYFKCFD